MKCMEAQAKIFAFIDGKLNIEENMELIKHIRSCRECGEELEISYALITAVNEAENHTDSEDYNTKLADKIARIERTFRRKTLRIKWKRVLLIAFMIAAGLLLK